MVVRSEFLFSLAFCYTLKILHIFARENHGITPCPEPKKYNKKNVKILLKENVDNLWKKLKKNIWWII